MKSIIITGYPKSGKTTIAKKLSKKYGISHLSLDAIIDAFEKIYPQLKITHNAKSTKILIEKLVPFVTHLLTRYYYYQIPFVLEGYHLDPVYLKQKFRKYKPLILAVGYSDIDSDRKLEITRRNSITPDWTKKIDDNVMKDWFAKAIIRCGEQKQLCEKNKIPYFNLGRDFKRGVRDVNKIVKDYLCKN